jgi:hypothetical protein
MLGAQKQKKTGFMRISFFSCVFRRNFSQERGFGGGRRNSCFLPLSQEFFAGIAVGQEFLYLLWLTVAKTAREQFFHVDLI